MKIIKISTTDSKLVGKNIAEEVRKLKKGEQYQLEFDGKISGKILTRRK